MYLRVKGASAGGFNGAGLEVRDVQDMLNNMHPAVATLHAMFEQPSCDSVKPTENIDYYDIDRSTTAAATSTFALGAGQSTTLRASKYPSQLFTRLQTYHEAVSASRESQQIRLYGIDNAMDYGIEQLLVRHMDIWERILHFSKGTEDATGTTGEPDNPVPQTQGLFAWAGWTGLELRHGAGVITTVGDGLQAIAKTYWTSFLDAAGTPLSRDLLYGQILGPAWERGHDTDGCFLLCSPKMMNAFADFNFVPGRGVVNERTIGARDKRIEDIITVISTPANGEIFLTPDRYMGITGANVTFDNSALGTAGGGNGSMTARTVYVDETILTVMPSKFKIPTMLGLSYRDLPSDGDYSVGMLVAQKGLSCKNLLGIAGATNLVP
jgi:hypothetical protein